MTSSLLYSLQVPPNKGQRLHVDIGVSKLLSTFGLDADFLESLLLSSVRADKGVCVCVCVCVHTYIDTEDTC